MACLTVQSSSKLDVSLILCIGKGDGAGLVSRELFAPQEQQNPSDRVQHICICRMA